MESKVNFHSEIIPVDIFITHSALNDSFKLMAEIDLTNTKYGAPENLLLCDLYLRCKGFSNRDISYSLFKLYDIDAKPQNPRQLCGVDRMATDVFLEQRKIHGASKLFAYEQMTFSGGVGKLDDATKKKILYCQIIIPAYVKEDDFYPFPPQYVPVNSDDLKKWSENIKKFKVVFEFETPLRSDVKYKLFASVQVRNCT